MSTSPRTSTTTATATTTINEMLSLPVPELVPELHSFPLFRRGIGDEHSLTCRVIEDISSTSMEESHPVVRREQHRRKLAGLCHAAYCTHSGPSPCPAHPHCLAHKRLYSHMASCREAGARCVIPGCAKARLIWTHFATCANVNCDICTVIPPQERNHNNISMVTPSSSGKARLPRSPKAAGISQLGRSPSRWPGRPPLSPKPRYQYHHDLPALSPPRSPTYAYRQFY